MRAPFYLCHFGTSLPLPSHPNQSCYSFVGDVCYSNSYWQICFPCHPSRSHCSEIVLEVSFVGACVKQLVLGSGSAFQLNLKFELSTTVLHLQGIGFVILFGFEVAGSQFTNSDLNSRALQLESLSELKVDLGIK